MRLIGLVTLCSLLCAASGLSGVSGRAPASGASQAPPVPTFSPAGGMGACPYSVSLTDSDSGAVIFYTTDGTEPTLLSARTTGTSITVSAPMTIKALAANLSGASASVRQNYVCGTFTSLTLTIQTGSDDARADSALQAVFVTGTGTTTWCLKYSDNGTFQSCAKQQPGVVWGVSSTNTSTVTLTAPVPPPVPLNGSTSLTIQLMEFPRGSETHDNWDLEGFTLMGNVSNASPNFPTSAEIWSVPHTHGTPLSPGNCFARFKHPDGPLSTVAFPLSFHLAGGVFPVYGPVTVMDSDGPHEAPYCK